MGRKTSRVTSAKIPPLRRRRRTGRWAVRVPGSDNTTAGIGYGADNPARGILSKNRGQGQSQKTGRMTIIIAAVYLNVGRGAGERDRGFAWHNTMNRVMATRVGRSGSQPVPELARSVALHGIGLPARKERVLENPRRPGGPPHGYFGRRRSNVSGNSGLLSSCGGSIGPGVWPVA